MTRRPLSPQKKWARKHKGKARAVCRRWRRRNPDRQRNVTYKWREKNRNAYNAYQRRWRSEHPAKVRRSTRRKYLAIRRNPTRYAKHLEAGRRWRKAHPDQERARAQRYVKNNREKVLRYRRKWMRKWYAAHREKARRKLRLRRTENPVKWRAYDRRIYRVKIRSNPRKYAKKLARGRLWARQNPMKQRHRVGRYRARTLMARGNHTLAEWLARVKRFGWLCYYCRRRLNSRTLTKDHRAPISKGGTDFARNLVPACKSCNSGKQNRRWRRGSRHR